MNLNWLREPRHQHLVERLWIVLVLVWSCVKALVIKDVFGKYGINTYIYLGIDLVIAIPYALSSARFVIYALEKHWKKAIPYAAAALILHFIPDVYILAGTKSVPKYIYLVFGATVVFFTGYGILEVRRQITKGRKNPPKI